MMDSDLMNHLNKCRMCLKSLRSQRKAVKITEDIKMKFEKLIGIEVNFC